jgi:hypothetical protein
MPMNFRTDQATVLKLKRLMPPPRRTLKAKSQSEKKNEVAARAGMMISDCLVVLCIISGIRASTILPLLLIRDPEEFPEPGNNPYAKKDKLEIAGTEKLIEPQSDGKPEKGRQNKLYADCARFDNLL